MFSAWFLSLSMVFSGFGVHPLCSVFQYFLLMADILVHEYVIFRLSIHPAVDIQFVHIYLNTCFQFLQDKIAPVYVCVCVYKLPDTFRKIIFII